MIERKSNTLFEHANINPTVDIHDIKHEGVFYTFSHKRELKRIFREKSAAKAIGKLYKGCNIFGLTKGQFSLSQLMSAILYQTGPAKVDISTWTAANADLQIAYELLTSGKITEIRFLIDFYLQKINPQFIGNVRESFGFECVRVTRNHAKFIVITNDEWNITIKTSMNLNANPRIEDFDISDNKELSDFLKSFLDEIFDKYKPGFGEKDNRCHLARFRGL